MTRSTLFAVILSCVAGTTLGCNPANPPEAVGVGGDPDPKSDTPPKAPAAPPKFQELLTLPALADEDKPLLGDPLPSVTVNRLAISPDGRLLAVHASIGQSKIPYAKFWELPGGKRHALWKLYKDKETPDLAGVSRPSLAFGLDGKRFYAAGLRNKEVVYRLQGIDSLHAWDISTGKLLSDDLPGYDPICHPNGKWVIVLAGVQVGEVTVVGESKLLALDVTTGKTSAFDLTTRLNPKDDKPFVAKVYPAAGVQTFDMNSEGDLFVFQGFSPTYGGGLLLCSTKPQFTSRLLSKERGPFDSQSRVDPAGVPVRALFTPDSKRVVGFSHPKYGPLETDRPDVIRVWDVSDGKLLTTAKIPHKIRDIAVSRDGNWVATACEDEAVRLFSTTTGAEGLALTGHKGAVKTLAFGRDGKVLVSGGEDGTVRVWKAE